VKRSAIRRFELIYHVIEKDTERLEQPQFSRLLDAQVRAEDLAIDLTEAYAQHGCRELCAAMQRTLPRELRDMVYDHILSPTRDEPIYIYGDCLDTIDGPHRGIIAAFAKPYGHAHMCSEDFVGLDTMSEFARRWYCHTKLRMFLTPTEVAKFLETDFWGLGVESDRLLRHVEVKVCEKEDEDNVTPLKQCLFKLAPGASIVFHVRTTSILGNGPHDYDEEFTMFLLSERVSALFPLMRQLIEAGYELYGALDGYEDFRVTPATLDREVWKDTLMAHCEGRDCG